MFRNNFFFTLELLLINAGRADCLILIGNDIAGVIYTSQYDIYVAWIKHSLKILQT